MISARQATTLHQEIPSSSGSFKTPIAKEAGGSRRSHIGPGQVPAAITMDEYGQTPDHFYLARNPPKPPAQRNQVKLFWILPIVRESFVENFECKDPFGSGKCVPIFERYSFVYNPLPRLVDCKPADWPLGAASSTLFFSNLSLRDKMDILRTNL